MVGAVARARVRPVGYLLARLVQTLVDARRAAARAVRPRRPAASAWRSSSVVGVYLVRAVRLSCTRDSQVGLGLAGRAARALGAAVADRATARRGGQFAEAVRVVYLSALYALDERALLHVESSQTNREHARPAQPRASGLAETFGEVVERYDRVRYGRFPVTEQTFTRIERPGRAGAHRVIARFGRVSRLRSSMVLLGICVAALLIGGLRLADRSHPAADRRAATRPSQTAPEACTTWVSRARRQPQPTARSTRARAGSAPATRCWSCNQRLPSTTRLATRSTPCLTQGGTLVVAGDSLPWLLYVRNLGITVEPIRDGASTAHTPMARCSYRSTCRVTGCEPTAPRRCCVAADGDWVGLRMPQRRRQRWSCWLRPSR